jgi:Replication-relaxation
MFMPARPDPALRGGQTGRPGRLARTPALAAELAARITPRDRWLLRMICEHRVLTTTQVTQLAFGTPRAATARLLTLTRLRAVDRFRPLARSGSAPWHHVLDDAGAVILAAEDGITPAQLGYRRDRVLAIALSPQLAHATGANDVLCALAAGARAGHGTLGCWWGERRCAALWGDLARPDAYGRWREPAPGGVAETEFFLEYDTGTEDLPRLVAKLTGYRMLAARTAITTPVLFWLPSPRREAALHDRLTAATTAGMITQVPVATATPALAGTEGPAGAVWLPAGRPGPRLRLAQLTTAWPAAAPAASTPPAQGSTQPPAEPWEASPGPGLPWHAPAPAPPPSPRYRQPGR